MKNPHSTGVKIEAPSSASSDARTFATTRWSVILSATDPSGDDRAAGRAMAELCRTYWRPIFLFVSRRGYSQPEAQDLTQDFFLMILESNWLKQADAHRGRFRSFLLKSLQNFLNHSREKCSAIKRGGKVEFISWDDWMRETPSRLLIAEETVRSLAPEVLFDLGWAATVVEHALKRLRDECQSKGRLRLFQVLSEHLASERADVSYATLGTDLGIAEPMIKKQLHNLRQRYRWLLRDEVAHTVENPSEVDDEIRYLCAVLATRD
jgi:DNA-directed RNA polymerase specialized sigma24 family protein